MNTKTLLAKKARNQKFLHWDNFIYPLDQTSILTKSLITKAITQFWEKHVEKMKDNQHIIALFRAENSLGTYFTLNRLKRLNKSDKEYWINFINDTLDIKSNDYKDDVIIKILISFGIREGMAPKVNKIIHPTKTFQNYRHYKLPITTDPLKYGELIDYTNTLNKYIIQITPLTIARIFQKLTKNVNINKVEILKKGNVILSYEDKWTNEDKFERTIGANNYIYIKDSLGEYKLDLFSVKKATRSIKPLDEDKNLDTKIISLDLETFNQDGKMIPYLISLYSDQGSKAYFLSDFNFNPDFMITTCIQDLMKSKFNGYKIYIHNLARFDSVFLLKCLFNLGSVNVTINKDRIISITLSFSKKKENKVYFLHFRDSYQLLLSSLRKLAKCFCVDTQKGIFPHRFVNKTNLDYIGAVPSFDFFDDITLDEYQTYSNQFNENYPWSLRDEAIRYCKSDSIALYQIMMKFIDMIFELYKINVNKYPTLPSLSFALFRTHYIRDNYFIPMLSGQTAKQIRLGYTGGATDMYIPENEDNELVYTYDVNGLYAFVMEHYPMPVGKHTYFEGDIRKYDPEAYGFFFCEVETPSNLEHPILQSHVATKGGQRTVAALGHYEDMLFSEEMDNAIKYGYKFKILWGYIFKKGYVFKDFINKLYSIRKEYPKDNPMNYIHKIIMNSLYGRFGMNDHFTITSTVDKNCYSKFEEINFEKMINIKEIGDTFLVELELDDTRTMLDNGRETHNVNVAIASAITGYARIVMSQFKNHDKLKLFYSDTDSIHTNLSPEQMNQLFKSIVNNKELGKLKLENVAQKAIYIAPKCYYLKTVNEEIIKVKGLDKNIPLTETDFKHLLIKNNAIEKSQEKWFKSFEDSTIYIKNQLYTLQQTDNKRDLVYNGDNKLIGTKPYMINKEKLIHSIERGK